MAIVCSSVTGETRHFYSANQKSMNHSGSFVDCCSVTCIFTTRETISDSAECYD